MDNGPWGGWVLTMASGINDNSNVVAATYYTNKAIWKSSDGGVTWEWAGLSGMSIYDVCAAPPSTFYAGTFDGLYASYDNGENWSLVPSMTTAVTAVGVSQADPNLIFVGIEGFGGVRRSTDGGATWGDVMLDGGRMYDLGIDPEHPDTVYLTMKGLDHPLYRSADGGSSWSGLGPEMGIYEEGGYNILVAPFGTGETILFSSDETLYISWDYGVTWNDGLYPGFGGLGTSDIVSDGTHLYATYPGDWNNVYPPGVIESSDGGYTWTMNTQGISDGVFYAAVITSQGILLGRMGGVYRSAGLGEPYQVSQEGICSFNTRCISYNTTTGVLFAGGGWRDGLWKSTDGGGTWSKSESGLTSWDIMDIQPRSDIHYQGQIMYVATEDGLFRSEDAGDNWVETGFTDLVLSVAFDPADPDKVWVGSHESVYYSTDGGVNWRAGSGFQGSDFYHVELVELENGDLRIIAGGDNQGEIYWSDDCGISYTRVPFPYPIGGFSSRWEDEPIVYVASYGGIHRSLDRGLSWECCDEFPGMTSCVLGTQNDLYANSDDPYSGWEGLWWSPDFGDSWLTSDNMLAPRVNAIAYSDSPNQVYVGLHGYGVEKITNDWMGIENSTPGIFAISASPNPASGNTTLSLVFPDVEPVSIMVFDSAGRLAAAFESNNGHAFWTPDPETPPGIYLIRANGLRGNVASTKVVLLR